MRVVLFAPTSRSLYSRLVVQTLHQMAGVEVLAIVVRRLWSSKRIRTDLRREGPRLLQKIVDKLVTPEKTHARAGHPLVMMAQERGLQSSTLSEFCRKQEIQYLRTDDFNASNCANVLRELAPDLIVFTGGGLIRANILEIPTYGVLNCHSGLLPQYRGMDTLEWTLLEAKESRPQVGLTAHLMDTGVDTGPILFRHYEDLQPGESLEAVRRSLETEMVHLLERAVRAILAGDFVVDPQQPADGRQYYVIHPRLREKAAEKLSRLT